MIVKREFVRLGKLFETDKEAEAVFMKAAKEAYDDEHRDSILSTLLRFSLSEREMGWCLTGIEDCRFVNHFGHDRKKELLWEKATSKAA